MINDILCKTDSRERILSNEWSNVANKIFYAEKNFFAVNHTFPIFANFPEPASFWIMHAHGASVSHAVFSKNPAKNLKLGVFETDFKQVPFGFRQTTRTYSESWGPVESPVIRISEFKPRYLDIFACGASKIAENRKIRDLEPILRKFHSYFAQQPIHFLKAGN